METNLFGTCWNDLITQELIVACGRCGGSGQIQVVNFKSRGSRIC